MGPVTMYEPAYQIKAGYRAIEGVLDGMKFRMKGGYWHREVGEDVFATAEAAKAEAEKRRVARIASLTKQLAKLNSLSHATPV